MVPGFNTDFKYRGETYHAQTEDNGLSNPVVVTLLYHKGAILASRRTSYRDLAAKPEYQQELQSLMKAQHKAIMRELLAGAFDKNGAAPAVAGASGEDPADAAAAVVAQAHAAPATGARHAPPPGSSAPRPLSTPAPATGPTLTPATAPATAPAPGPAAVLSLDQAIRSFLEDYAAAMAAGHLAQRSR